MSEPQRRPPTRRALTLIGACQNPTGPTSILPDVMSSEVLDAARGCVFDGDAQPTAPKCDTWCYTSVRADHTAPPSSHRERRDRCGARRCGSAMAWHLKGEAHPARAAGLGQGGALAVGASRRPHRSGRVAARIFKTVRPPAGLA